MLMRPGGNERHVLETDELMALMESIHGLSYVQEITENGVTFRSGIGTFTPEEFRNLEQ
jgi:hypothetical protein